MIFLCSALLFYFTSLVNYVNRKFDEARAVLVPMMTAKCKCLILGKDDKHVGLTSARVASILRTKDAKLLVGGDCYLTHGPILSR